MDKQAKVAIVTAFIVVALFSVVFVMAGPKECNDNIDNDGDGDVDFPADAGCSSRTDDDESNCGDNVCEGSETPFTCGGDCVTQCNDGIDNDGDSNVDLSDVGCTNVADNSEANCGDNVVQGAEACDGSALNNQTCSTQGYTGGTLSCNSSCTGFVTTSCYTQVCGNNVIEGTEVCDGTSLGNQTCSSQGYSGGTLQCNGSCNGYNTSSCYTNSCADSDFGTDPFVQGTVSGSNGGSSFSYTDFCSDFIHLTEFSCNGVQPVATNTSCVFNGTGSCNTGACV